jgi:hypothetical protein
MATRMQQRRGTAAQWISTNGGAGPVLNAGEMGWESDTNKFKIGDGVNNWTSLDYFSDINSTVNPAFGSSITFEGATANDFETTLAITDPTADRTITIPDVTGTVITTGNLSDITNIGVFTSTITMEGSTANDFELTISAGDPTADRTATFPDATGTIVLDSTTQTLTNKTIAFGSNTVTSTLAQLNTAISDADVASLAGSETLTNKTLTTPVISSITNGAATLTLPTSTGTIALTTDIPSGVVTETGTQTLTNKTLTSPVITGAVFNDGSIVLEGATANDHETTITVTDPTADRTITLPDATGTVALTNNKLDAFAATTSAELRSVISDETGTGGLVFADTPTLITPNIGAATGTSLVLSGDLTVNGTTTTINSTEITVDDKNLTLGSVATPTDAGADGGGITLKGATDKTLNWVDATDSWTSSEHFNLASGKVLKIAGTQVLSATEYTGNAATVTNGVYTTSKISALAATSSSELASVISDETGTGALVFANTPTLVTPELGAATGTSLALPDALVGSATATAGTSATTIDTFSATTYSAAKYVVQMKKSGNIEVIEILVAVDGSDNVYLTEYANVQSNGELGTTNAVYSGGNVLLQVTAAAADTAVKVSKTYIEA